MIFAKSTYRADGAHSLISTYPLCFDTLAHTWVRRKAQPLSFQPLPHSCPQNTRGGYTSKTMKSPPDSVPATHCSPPCPSSLGVAILHPLTPLSSAVTKKGSGVWVVPPYLLTSLPRYLIASLLRHSIFHLQTLRTLQFRNHPHLSDRIGT